MKDILAFEVQVENKNWLRGWGKVSLQGDFLYTLSKKGEFLD